MDGDTKRHGMAEAPAEGRHLSTERAARAGRRPASPKELRHRMIRSLQRQRRAAQPILGAMPSMTTRAKKGHVVHDWIAAGRDRLVTEAQALGVLDDSTQFAIGPRGEGQFRTPQALAAAVKREREVQAVRAFVDEVTELIPRVGAAIRQAVGVTAGITAALPHEKK